MRKIGISLGGSDDLPMQEYAMLLQENGFSCTFELADNMERVCKNAEILSQYGIEYDSLHAPWQGINRIWWQEDQEEIALKGMMYTVDICAEIGCRNAVVHLSSGRTPPPPTDAGRARFIRLVEYAEKKKVTVAFENQRMLSNIAWAFEEFKDSPYVGFCYDCGHEGCFTPGRQYMPLFGSKLVCTHIHDNNCNFNEDLHRLPFDGKLDYDRVARQIRESGFEGPLVLEVSRANEYYASLSNEEFLSRASASIKKLRDMTDPA